MKHIHGNNGSTSSILVLKGLPQVPEGMIGSQGLPQKLSAEQQLGSSTWKPWESMERRVVMLELGFEG